MKTTLRHLLPLLLLLGGTLAGCAHKGEALKVGDTVPGFQLTGSDGKTWRLSDFKGKKAVVVAWFPKAFTGG